MTNDMTTGAGMKIFFTELTEKCFWTVVRKKMHFPS